jgi:hypothetical protein
MATSMNRTRRSRGIVWCCVVFVVALPAIGSPILFLPVASHIPRWLGAMLGPVLSHPKLWATAATFLAVLGAKRIAPPMPQTIAVALVTAAAWWLGTDTAEKLWCLF